MAIQMRRGDYTDFRSTKMVAGEFAVVQSGDPDTTEGRSVYICFEPGVVKRMVTYEDFENYFNELADEFKAEFSEEVQAAIKEALDAADAANAAAQSFQSEVDNVTKIAEDGAAEAKKIAEEAGEEAKQIATDGASDAIKAAEEAGEEAKQIATEGASDAKQIAEEAGEEAKQIAESASAEAKQVADEAATSATEAAKSASDAADKADNAADLATAAAGSGVADTRIKYAYSESGTEPPESGWTDDPPTVEAGMFLWTRVTLVLNSGDETVFYSISKMGSEEGIRFSYDADDKNITITY